MFNRECENCGIYSRNKIWKVISNIQLKIIKQEKQIIIFKILKWVKNIFFLKQLFLKIIICMIL